MKKLAVGLSMAALVLGGSALAAPGATKTKADADGNGVITRAEAQAKAEAMFTRFDVNKDGKIDQADRQAMREARQTRMFERLDADKNGQISKAEFMAERGPGDRGQRMAAGEPGKDGSGWGKGRRHHGRHGGMMMGRMAHAGKDGPTTRAQFTAAALQRFDAMDANKDGQVTQAERQAAREQMKAKWQQMRAQKAQG